MFDRGKKHLKLIAVLGIELIVDLVVLWLSPGREGKTTLPLGSQGKLCLQACKHNCSGTPRALPTEAQSHIKYTCNINIIACCDGVWWLGLGSPGLGQRGGGHASTYARSLRCVWALPNSFP